ncbi:GNAT family N-acetyltransferase [Conexibacter sp. DBS9H8]|uniref:GNAT family N-acetyltransferase n=1 Tax=Conexibacter sp. DBS9H8 TaxID=2937801 RepID=UPI0020101DB0|nr:GNAT family protein [Conexibacter sp. DBS9H8]
MSEMLTRAGGRRTGGRSRVYLRGPGPADEREFITLMQASATFHRPWASAPSDHERFVAYLEDAKRDNFVALLVCRREDDAILGFFNISQIVRRLFQSAYLGYAIGRPYAGQGYMAEAIEQVLEVAFLELRLHRLEANIQPGNEPSLALARRAGFQREGFSPRYLKIGGRWRDHERWAILAEDWLTARGLR